MTVENSPLPPSTSVSSSDKALMILCHLAVFIGVPLLLPFIVWLVKRNEPDRVGAHAAEALNFHLSMLLYSICCVPLIFLFGLGAMLALVIGIATLVLAIIAAIRASEGELYRYPLTIRLVK